MGKLLAVLVLAAAGPLRPLAAQSGPVRPGDRVRVKADTFLPPTVAGRVTAADSAALTLVPDGDSIEHRVPWRRVRRLELSDGARTRGQGVRRGAGIGLIAGAATGAVATTAVYLSDADEGCQDCWISATTGVAILSVAGTLTATLVGGVIGAARPGERWTRVPVPRIVSGAGSAGTFSLGVTVPF